MDRGQSVVWNLFAEANMNEEDVYGSSSKFASFDMRMPGKQNIFT